ncbi:hypothetical protein CO111_00190 [Candidatus Desantisbacteria bacterium CG_4_9_14_3_um_filter_50_7]|nr:MAG: hypothetical protein CO111_00190 [Candidatus Desantisbacteria bacterium CG_4_9_14_3_um_filter_50_7]
MKAKRGTAIIQSLDRGLKLLEVIGRSGTPLALNDLISALDIDRSSIFRLLLTLENRGYLERDDATRRYRLGGKILELSGKLYEGLKITDIARPFLEELTRKTKESSHIAIYSNGRSLLIDKEDSSEVIFVNMDVGRSEPLHCTALGKALLISFPKEKIKSLLSGKLEKYTRSTKTGVKSVIAEIERAGRQGFAVDNGEYRDGVRCIAAPVYDFRGKVAAAIGVSGPVSRIGAKKIKGIIKEVKSAAGRFSRKLGYKKQINRTIALDSHKKCHCEKRSGEVPKGSP